MQHTNTTKRANAHKQHTYQTRHLNTIIKQHHINKKNPSIHKHKILNIKTKRLKALNKTQTVQHKQAKRERITQ